MTRERRMTKGDGIARWLLPASVLHAGFVLLAAALAPWKAGSLERAASSRSPEAEWSLDLTLLDDQEASLAPASEPAGPLRIESASAVASDAPGARRIAVAVPRPAPVNAAAPSLPASSEAPTAPTAAQKPSIEDAPTLSLEQLGIGTNPFLGVALQPLTKEEQANARLHAALHPRSLESDSQRGLGPAGPVANAARSLVIADDALLETSAVLNVSVDGSGHVTEVHVLDASSQSPAWQLIAARLTKALATVKLPADSQRAWAMKLRLASTVQLPSGAAPGMRLGVLGQQVGGSGGPGSTSLELSPTSKLDLREIEPDSVGRKMDEPVLVEFMLLKLRADPADVGATARRVVEVAVLSIGAPGAP